MPLSKTGQKVMRDMKDRYGEKKGERVFYATENKMAKKTGDSGVWHAVPQKKNVVRAK